MISNIINTLLNHFNNVFTIGSIYYLIFLVISFYLLYLIIVNKKFILENYTKVIGALLIICLIPELIVYYDSIIDENYLRIIPLGMCHLSVYLTTFLIFKYNRNLHILTILLAAGGILSILIPVPIDGISLTRIRPYYFYLIHFYIVAANIILMHKHNVILTVKDYLYGMTKIFMFIALFIFLSLFTKNDELFFFTGPEGTILANVDFGIFRVIVALFVYFVVYSVPYLAYLYLKNYSYIRNSIK